MANHLVIMAGGVGSRFWPMSTPERPKQFLDITGCGRTMIQQTVDRFGSLIDMEHVWVVTSAHYAALVAEQLDGIQTQHILLEPCMRNTAPCIAYVSWKIQAEDPDAAIFVAASDHLVTDVAEFRRIVALGLDFVASEARILTLGMRPTRPETGYGYIQQGALCDLPTSSEAPIYRLQAFREKPDLATAERYLSSGDYTWNSGMFLWSVRTIVAELRQYAPEIAAVMDRIAPAFFTPQEQDAVNEYFPTCPKISIDYAVMEKTTRAYVLPAEFGWSDLGTWGSLHVLTPQDEARNAVIGDNVSLIESQGCMVRMPAGKKVVIQGLQDCIVVEHEGVLLICRLQDEQRIKEWHS
jgi:mannose-1-phosphate guanylyltransferase